MNSERASNLVYKQGQHPNDAIHILILHMEESDVSVTNQKKLYIHAGNKNDFYF